MNASSDRNRRVLIRREHGVVTRRGMYLRPYEIHALFDELIHRPWGAVRWNPAVDVREDKDTFFVEIDLPGVKPEEVQVFVDGRILAVEGHRQLRKCDEETSHLCERPDGRFVRTFEFDGDIEGRRIESRWHDGVLTIAVPKSK